MEDKEKIIKQVLCKNGAMFLCFLVFGIYTRIIFPTIDADLVVLQWKYDASEFAYDISPLIILVASKSLIFLLFDLLFQSKVEKTIILYLYVDNMTNFLFEKEKFDLLIGEGKFIRLRAILSIVHIFEPIWVARRMINVDCQVAHKYQITMLRFTHLVLNIKEIIDVQAFQEQLNNALGWIETEQGEIELCEFQIHEQQRKYATNYYKYMNADDEQQKDVYLSKMQQIGAEIDRLKKEKENHEKILKSYEQEKQKIEEMLVQSDDRNVKGSL